MLIRPRIALFFLFLFAGISLFGQKVFVLRMQDEVNAASARYISRGFEEAIKADAALVILHLDTYGGRVDHADSMRSHILDAPMPTAVFIDRNAGSAGALLSIACDSIYMAPGASIGAATVVMEGTTEAAPDKYQSYWRGIMRSTAEKTGRDPRIAEKMVDQKLDLPGISPAGQVITFSTKEAIANGYCEGERLNVTEVAKSMGIAQPEIIKFEGNAIDKAINWLIHPTVAAFLMLMIFGGLFMEMKTPGMGFPGLVALLGIALFFAPHYIEGLANSWEIALFMTGVALIAVEIFIIPGFGFAGIFGILFSVAGIAAALLDNNDFTFQYVGSGDALRAVALVFVMLISAILLVIVLARYLVSSQAAYPFVDQSTEKKSDGFSAVSGKILEMIGEEGVALTDLRPSGYIQVYGKQYDAEAEAKEGFINKGTKVKITSVRSINLIVEKI